MNWKQEIRKRLAKLNLEPTREAEVIEELAQHLEDRYAELLLKGATENGAYQEVLAELSQTDLLQRELRRVEHKNQHEPIVPGTNRGAHIISDLWQDLRYGWRMLTKHPGFTFVAVATLALGLGVNTALFTVFDVFMLKPLPVKDPNSLVTLSGVDQSGGRRQLFSCLDYLDYRDRNTTLSELVAWSRVAVEMGEARAARDNFSRDSGSIFGQIVSANYFNALGADMSLGRGFLPEEDQTPGTHAVVVLSHRFWERQFDGDPLIVGKTIRLQSEPFTVVGVTSRDFIGTALDEPAFWAPLMMRDQLIPLAPGEHHQRWLTEREADSFLLLGRLKPGEARSAARAEFAVIAQQLAEEYPGKDRKTGVVMKSAATLVPLDAKQLPLIVPLLVAFGLVLLIACANVANLLLARAALRQKEIGVRLALGASRVRVIRQLLTESILFSAIGGLAGLLAASWTLRVLYQILLTRLPELPSFLNLEVDYRIFGFTLLIAVIAGVAAGLAPALQASRLDLTVALKSEGAALGQHLSLPRLRNGLIVTQVAVSLALLIGTGLLVRNLQKEQSIDVGFEPHNLFSVAVTPNAAGEQTAQQRGELRRRVAERLRVLPGVISVSHAYRQPSSGQLSSTPIALTRAMAADERQPSANYNFVSPEYFETLGIRIVRGRSFTAQEANANAAVVIVSEETAQKFWPGEDAIGQRLGIAAAALTSSRESDSERSRSIAAGYPYYEVIGIARDTRSGWVYEKDLTYLYLPLAFTNQLDNFLIVRAESDAVMAAIRAEAEAIDPHLSVVVQRTTDLLDDHLTPFRALALIAGVLGALALMLASLGLYGVMSFVVTHRTREIGVRIALGAQGADVIWLFLKEGLTLTAIGIAIGLAGGAGISRLLASVLFDLSPLDPLSFGGVSIFLALVAFAACVIPARRSTKVDPMIALRYE